MDGGTYSRTLGAVIVGACIVLITTIVTDPLLTDADRTVVHGSVLLITGIVAIAAGIIGYGRHR